MTYRQSNLVTVTEAAAMFHVSTDTIRRWSRQGRLTTYRTLGGHRRFDRDELVALLNREPDDD